MRQATDRGARRDARPGLCQALEAGLERDLLAAGVGYVAVNDGTIESVMWSDDFGRAGGYVVDVVHPLLDEHPRHAPLVRVSRSSTRALPGGLLGDATDKILAGIGHDADSIADLRARNIVA